jgi:ribosomal protein S18 acetylase RimI-like enzyme
MAALAESPFFTVDLRSVDVDRLAPVIDAQIAEWRAELSWDFTLSANLVRRFVKLHALAGCALVMPGASGQVLGYSYFVAEEGKGLIGDLYVLKPYRNHTTEGALLQASLDALWKMPDIKRVESQLLLLSDNSPRHLPYRDRLRAFPRLFLEAPLTRMLPPRELKPSIRITPWTVPLQEATGRLIAGAYQQHVDSQINDQYRSPLGARRFLTNIVQYPGCGSFFAPASFAAFAGDALCGASLASLVASNAGHITQVCVAPSHQGEGLGYDLVRRSMEAMARSGCTSVSLTVTAANESALKLYRDMGFAPRRSFFAYVWES